MAFRQLPGLDFQRCVVAGSGEDGATEEHGKRLAALVDKGEGGVYQGGSVDAGGHVGVVG